MSVARFEQLMKGCSAWAMFQLVPNLRKRYPRGHLWGIKSEKISGYDTYLLEKKAEIARNKYFY